MGAGHEDASAVSGDARAESNETGQKGFAMDVDLVQLLHPRRALPKTSSSTDLITCSLCMRVLRGSEWLEAERVISEMRTYELDELPRLHSRVCDSCAESIFSRRAQAGAPLAA
jgi:hypothetical protein